MRVRWTRTNTLIALATLAYVVEAVLVLRGR